MSSGVVIGVERVGARVYVVGDTYAIKDSLKAAGCKWDGERRQWWAGLAKADAVQRVVDGVASGAVKADVEDLSRAEVHGKVVYKGRAYFVIGVSRDGEKLRLTVLDGAIVFWAAASLCEWSRRYERRSEGYGRYARERLPSLGSIQAFVARQKNPETARVQCHECGSWHDAGMSCRECGGC